MFATRRRLIPLAAIVVVISLVSLGVYVWWQKRRLDVGDVPLLKTPAWEFQRFDEATRPSSDLIYGQRYHEILSLPDAKRVGKPVRIPVTDRNDFLDICWSADEEFVVYTTYFFNMLVVVDTGL